MNKRIFFGLIFARACAMLMVMSIQTSQPLKPAGAGAMPPTAPQAPAAPRTLPIAASLGLRKQPKKTDVKTHAESTSQSLFQGRMLDAIIFTGMGENEENAAVTHSFAFALCQHATPLIVSSWVFNTFLSMKSKNFIHFKNSEINPLEWRIYVNKTKTLYVLIPIEYSEKLEKTYAKSIKEYQQKTKQDYNPDDILVGLNLSTLTQLPAYQVKRYTDLSTKKEKEEIVNSVIKHYIIPIADFKALFVQGTDDIFGMWNIMLDGHGNYPKGLDFAAKSAQSIDVSKASIASFTISEYRELIQFFTKNIKVNFLYYVSCFGGDYNLILPYMTTLINERERIMGGIVKPNFTIVSGSLTSQVVRSSLTNSIDYCSDLTDRPAVIPVQWMGKHLLNYKRFFELLHSYNSAKTNRPMLYTDEQLKKILQEITPRMDLTEANPLTGRPKRLQHDVYGISGLPQVMLPDTDVFRAVALTDKIAVIGQVLTRKHEIEKEPFALHNKEAILLYPKVITVEMNITIKPPAQGPGIVSMQPGIGLHKLAKVTSNMTFEQIVKHSFGATQPVFTKYYFIEQLTLTGDEYLPPVHMGDKTTIYNVFVLQENQTIYVLFESLNNKNHIFFAEYDAAVNILSVKRIETTISKAIPQNEFLNALYNYFIASPELRDTFNFDNVKKKVLTPEENNLLFKHWNHSYDTIASLMSNPTEANLQKAAALITGGDTNITYQEGQALKTIAKDADAFYKESYGTKASIKWPNAWNNLMALLERPPKAFPQADIKTPKEQLPEHPVHGKPEPVRTQWTNSHTKIANLINNPTESNLQKAEALIRESNIDTTVTNKEDQTLKTIAKDADALYKESYGIKASVKWPKAWNNLMTLLEQQVKTHRIWTDSHTKIANLINNPTEANLQQAEALIRVSNIDTTVANKEGQTLKTIAKDADALYKESYGIKASVKWLNAWDNLIKLLK